MKNRMLTSNIFFEKLKQAEKANNNKIIQLHANNELSEKEWQDKDPLWYSLPELPESYDEYINLILDFFSYRHRHEGFQSIEQMILFYNIFVYCYLIDHPEEVFIYRRHQYYRNAYFIYCPFKYYFKFELGDFKNSVIFTDEIFLPEFKIDYRLILSMTKNLSKEESQRFASTLFVSYISL